VFLLAIPLAAWILFHGLQRLVRSRAVLAQAIAADVGAIASESVDNLARRIRETIEAKEMRSLKDLSRCNLAVYDDAIDPSKEFDAPGGLYFQNNVILDRTVTSSGSVTRFD
jgi:hypothetical protein